MKAAWFFLAGAGVQQANIADVRSSSGTDARQKGKVVTLRRMEGMPRETARK